MMAQYKEYVDNFNDRLRSKLRGVFADRVDLAFGTGGRSDQPGDCVVTVPETGLKVEIRALGTGMQKPLKRVEVRLRDDLPGNPGTMRREFRSSGSVAEVDPDRILGHVVEIMDLAGPLYRLRRTVKDSVWPLFGLDPREIEDARKIRYRGRDLVISIQWSTYWLDDRDRCCVMVLARDQSRTSGTGINQRKIEWSWHVGDVVNEDQFRQQIQQELQEWDQQDRASAGIRDLRDQNELAVRRIRDQYQNLSEVSLGSNAEGFIIMVRVTTEQEVVDLLESLLKNRD